MIQVLQKKIAYTCNHAVTSRDFSFWEEELYKKKTGEFFLHGTGGPMSKYREYICGAYTEGEKITPLTEDEARQWAEHRLDGFEYEEIFGEVEE